MSAVLTEVENIDAFRAPIIIRYEGRLAEAHTIELSQLGESIQGFAKAIAVAANFACTGNANMHFDALDVKVLARPVPEHHCFEVWATIEPLVQTKEFWAGAIVAAATVFAPVLTYILSSRKSEEMKHLSDALKQSMTGNQQVTDRLVSTVEKLAEALNPSVRKALAPIDRSCSQIDISQGGQALQSMNTETKAVFASSGSRVSDNSRIFTGIITQFSMVTGSCSVLLDGEADAVSGRVLDPVFSEPNNPYATAMTAKQPLTFLARFERDAAGKIQKLHILDTATLA